MTERTADESLQQNIAAMGDELGRLYSALWQEVAWLHRKWEEYVVLFGTKPERLELLNQSAPAFFRVVQDSLWADVLIHVCRLTDPPKSAGRSNLTCQRLPPLVSAPSLKNPLDSALGVAISASEFCRDWRNRTIAHRDLALVFGSGVDPLQHASREGVKSALAAIAGVLNTVSSHYCGSTTMFEFGGSIRGAEDLLYVLDDGLIRERERRERLRNGTVTAEELRPRAL